MSQKDQEAWEALLDAVPALQAAWDEFQATLASINGRLTPRLEHHLAELRDAALQVCAAAGEDQTHH